MQKKHKSKDNSLFRGIYLVSRQRIEIKYVRFFDRARIVNLKLFAKSKALKIVKRKSS